MSRTRVSEEEKRARKKAYAKKYWQEHKAECNEAVKRWRKAHPEKARELNTTNHSKWVEANRDKWNAYMREYRKKRKEKKRES